MGADAEGRQVETGKLAERLAAVLPPNHPLRVAVDRLPATVSRGDYIVLLRVLLPLARLHEDF